ncbi:MAG TPA: cell division protein FtsQ/DivIB [Burkholderiaceae bacterium]
MLLRHSAAADAAAPTPGGLPVDIRLMNAIAVVVLALVAIGLAGAGARWLALRPAFSFEDLQLEGDLQRNSVTTVRANALPHLKGNFFTMDLGRARAAFEQVPWVRRAVVRRVWPDRLVVTLEEHQPVALWSAGDDASDRMVNSYGEVFEANVGDVEEDGLPEFSGPDGSAAQVLAMYRRLKPVFAQMDAEITALALSGRGSWRAELDSGAAIELGRGSDDEVVERGMRFVRTLPQVLKRIGAPLESADLRHAEGYAVKFKGVGFGADPKQPPAAARRQ